MILGALVETAKIMLKSVFDQAVQIVSSGARFRWLSKKYDIFLNELLFEFKSIAVSYTHLTLPTKRIV